MMVLITTTPWVSGTRAEKYVGPIYTSRRNVELGDVALALDEMLTTLAVRADALACNAVVGCEAEIDIEGPGYTMKIIGTGAFLTGME